MNKLITWILVIVSGILLGIGMLSKKLQDPLWKELFNQQEKILASQKRIEKIFVSQEGDNLSEQVEKILVNQERLEKRLNNLDAALKQGLPVGLQGANAGNTVSKVLSPPPEDYSKIYSIETAHSYIQGPKDAPVDVVEFIDFQCPYCARFHPTLLEAMKPFEGKIRYIVKNFPLSFHPKARPASKAAFAAGEQGKYFEMVDALLVNRNELTEDTFKGTAAQLGLNVEQFMKDYKEKDSTWEEYINKDIQDGRKADVRGTPTFYIGGRKSLARDAQEFKQEIEKALKEKK